MNDNRANPGNKFLPNAPELATPAVSRMLEFARRSGRDPARLVTLVRGEPDFRTPEHICRSLWEAIEAGYTHYPPVHGYAELRRAVAHRVQIDHNLEFDPDQEVLITTGATTGMYVALLAVVRPGDEVLLPEPIYDPYPNQVRILGGRPVFVPTERQGSHFHISKEALEATVSPHTRAIILNTPWNPTGAVLSGEELLQIGEFAVEHDLIVIVDEIYEKFVYDGHVHHCLAGLSADFRERVITINSFSKTYAMTGWRLGYNLASPALTRAMRLHFEQLSRGSTAFVQRAGLAALSGSQDPVNEMVAEYTRRRRLMVDGLNEIEGLECIAPEGTLFCLVKAQAYHQSSEELAQFLVREWGLLTVPGSYYGPSLDNYLRLSFSYSPQEIASGLELLAEGLQQMRH